ncbi:MAG: hypothetical protein M1834_008235 [Cirrosporium novae-zelandiae]|nr:MAG: hypothetical protein M1834_008235 [Cirrosporium novae-zelandiae]
MCRWVDQETFPAFDPFTFLFSLLAPSLGVIYPVPVNGPAEKAPKLQRSNGPLHELLHFSLYVIAYPTPEQHDSLDFQRRGSLTSRDSSLADIYSTRFSDVTWDNTNWRLSTTALDQGHYQSRISIANGYIGINVAAVGPFFEADTPVNGDNVNGWPLYQERISFATISGFFDSQPTTNSTNFEWLNQYGGESVISGVPHWGALILDLGNGIYLDAEVNASEISNFSSTLDLKKGLMNWEYTWTPSDANGASFDIEYTMFANKLLVTEAVVQLQVTPSKDFNGSIVNVIDGTSAVRTQFADKGSDGQSIYSSVRPNGISNVTGFIYATMSGTSELDVSSSTIVTEKPYIGTNDSSIAQSAPIALKQGVTSTITKFVGIASSDAFSDPQAVAKDASLSALGRGLNQSLGSHIAEWASVFPATSVDSYAYPNGTLPSDPDIIELQITSITNSYYLLQNTISENAFSHYDEAPINVNSISVGGLTSDSYAGLIFWDAEIWMQPGLVAAFPFAAKQISNYRVERYGQALVNAQTSYQSSKNTTTFSSDAAAFPWTSGRFGNCTGTGPCFDYEYHINGDIVMEFGNYWAITGDTTFFEEKLFPIHSSIATFYSELLQYNETVDKWSLTNMTDPDEYANHVDNGGYTMPLIADTLEDANAFAGFLGLPTNTTWESQANNVLIEKNEAANIIYEYTSANNSITVKQADVILDIYPLAHTANYTTSDARSDLEYYAGKQSSDGPAMTYAIFSIAESEIAASGCAAYTYDLYSSQPYTRGPWFQFSEQLIDDYELNGGTHPAYPFLTGHGGSLQVALFGYLGLRIEPSFTMVVDPSLPPQIPQIQYRTFYWQGWPISAYANQTHTTLTRPPSTSTLPLTTANETFVTAPIEIQLSLAPTTANLFLHPNSTLTLPNNPAPTILTIPNNLLQCLPIASTSTPLDSNTDTTANTADTYIPGQFPLAAIDGSGTTKWQPTLANTSSSLTIDTRSIPFQPLSGLYFDWAQAPPSSFSVYVSNSSSPPSSISTTSTTLLASQNVTISNPYNALTIAVVAPYESNTTNITFSADGAEVWSGRWATLVIEGNLSGDEEGKGATVAEWGLLGKEGDENATVVVGRRDRDSGSAGRWIGMVEREVVSEALRRGEIRKKPGF